MTETALLTAVATYRVRADRLEDFFEVLRRHHPALLELGLATDEPPIVYRGKEQDGGPIVFEIFTWANERAPQIAHETPQVLQLWEPMGDMCEERGGRPRFEFPHVERVEL